MHRLFSCASVVVFALAALAASSPAVAQVSPANESKKAEEVYKNIKALRGTPANELNQSMHLMKGAVGLDCVYCHIEREWEKDVKPAKEVARAMIVMMNDINTRQFGGKQVVTCNTCHNGHPTPAAVPVFPVLRARDHAEAGASDRRPDSGEVRPGPRRRAGAAQGHDAHHHRHAVHPDRTGRRGADARVCRAAPEGAEPRRDDVPRAGVCDRGRVRRDDGLDAEPGGPRGANRSSSTSAAPPGPPTSTSR